MLAGVATVVDGGTIEIDGQRIRLLDMDAPVADQLCQDTGGADYPCGRRAARELADHLGEGRLVCDWAIEDRDGRKLGRCSLEGHDAGLWLIEQGWALPDRDCKCETYRAAAARAEQQGLGLWAGSFVPPWVWRAAH